MLCIGLSYLTYFYGKIHINNFLKFFFLNPNHLHVCTCQRRYSLCLFQEYNLQVTYRIQLPYHDHFLMLIYFYKKKNYFHRKAIQLKKDKHITFKKVVFNLLSLFYFSFPFSSYLAKKKSCLYFITF